MKDLEARFWKHYIIQKYLKTGKQSLIIIIISERVKGPVTFK
jgi:glutathione synthase/RimK-type ligase-like ATP-grasp enzyme